MESIVVVPYCSRVLELLGITVLMAAWAVIAEEECINKEVLCYECDSRTDQKCADPFNFTLHPKNLPNYGRCEGCCVKIVRMKGTPYESVWRTCTQRLQINLFMVDHVCMYESNQLGHMCFCEEDMCNNAHTTFSYFFFSYYSAPFLLLTYSILFNLALTKLFHAHPFK